MTYTDDRQAGDEKKEGATIEVTPGMVEAGKRELVAFDWLESDAGDAGEAVRRVYCSMVAASLQAKQEDRTDVVRPDR